MTKRIRELAEQADEYAEQTVHYYQGQFDGLTWEGKIKQTRDTKFAELIVEEMLEITDAYTEVFQTDRDWALIKHIKQSVRQHFGVEE